MRKIINGTLLLASTFLLIIKVQAAGLEPSYSIVLQPNNGGGPLINGMQKLYFPVQWYDFIFDSKTIAVPCHNTGQGSTSLSFRIAQLNDDYSVNTIHTGLTFDYVTSISVTANGFVYGVPEYLSKRVISVARYSNTAPGVYSQTMPLTLLTKESVHLDSDYFGRVQVQQGTEYCFTGNYGDTTEFSIKILYKYDSGDLLASPQILKASMIYYVPYITYHPNPSNKYPYLLGTHFGNRRYLIDHTVNSGYLLQTAENPTSSSNDGGEHNLLPSNYPVGITQKQALNSLLLFSLTNIGTELSIASLGGLDLIRNMWEIAQSNMVIAKDKRYLLMTVLVTQTSLTILQITTISNASILNTFARWIPGSRLVGVSQWYQKKIGVFRMDQILPQSYARSLCHKSCLDCGNKLKDQYDCTSCHSGVLNGDNSCACLPAQGVFLDGTQCKECEHPCLTCTGNAITCSSCAPNYVHDPLTNTCICPSGFSEYGESCLQCSNNCQTCLGLPQNCLTCKEFFIKEPLGNGKCVCDTASGLFANELGECVKCDTSCLTCDSADKSVCTSCEEGKYLDLGICRDCFDPLDPQSYCEQCIDPLICITCQPNFILNLIDNICEPCLEPCQTCSSGREICDSCIPGYTHSQGGCVCSQGSFIKSDGSGDCSECDAPCETCESYLDGSKCTSCVSGKFLLGNQCLESCPLGTFGKSSDGTCTECFEKCAECSEGGDSQNNEFNCTSCKYGLILIFGDCVCENYGDIFDSQHNLCKTDPDFVVSSSPSSASSVQLSESISETPSTSSQVSSSDSSSVPTETVSESEIISSTTSATISANSSSDSSTEEENETILTTIKVISDISIKDRYYMSQSEKVGVQFSEDISSLDLKQLSATIDEKPIPMRNLRFSTKSLINFETYINESPRTRIIKIRSKQKIIGGLTLTELKEMPIEIKVYKNFRIMDDIVYNTSQVFKYSLNILFLILLFLSRNLAVILFKSIQNIQMIGFINVDKSSVVQSAITPFQSNFLNGSLFVNSDESGCQIHYLQREGGLKCKTINNVSDSVIILITVGIFKIFIFLIERSLKFLTTSTKQNSTIAKPTEQDTDETSLQEKSKSGKFATLVRYLDSKFDLFFIWSLIDSMLLDLLIGSWNMKNLWVQDSNFSVQISYFITFANFGVITLYIGIIVASYYNFIRPVLIDLKMEPQKYKDYTLISFSQYLKPKWQAVIFKISLVIRDLMISLFIILSPEYPIIQTLFPFLLAGFTAIFCFTYRPFRSKLETFMSFIENFTSTSVYFLLFVQYLVGNNIQQALKYYLFGFVIVLLFFANFSLNFGISLIVIIRKIYNLFKKAKVDIKQSDKINEDQNTPSITDLEISDDLNAGGQNQPIGKIEMQKNNSNFISVQTNPLDKANQKITINSGHFRKMRQHQNLIKKVNQSKINYEQIINNLKSCKFQTQFNFVNDLRTNNFTIIGQKTYFFFLLKKKIMLAIFFNRSKPFLKSYEQQMNSLEQMWFNQVILFKVGLLLVKYGRGCQIESLPSFPNSLKLRPVGLLPNIFSRVETVTQQGCSNKNYYPHCIKVSSRYSCLFRSIVHFLLKKWDPSLNQRPKGRALLQRRNLHMSTTLTTLQGLSKKQKVQLLKSGKF